MNKLMIGKEKIYLEKIVLEVRIRLFDLKKYYFNLEKI